MLCLLAIMAVNREQFGVVRGVAIAAAVLLGVTTYCLKQHNAYEPKDRLMLWLKWNAPKAGDHGKAPYALAYSDGYCCAAPAVQLLHVHAMPEFSDAARSNVSFEQNDRLTLTSSTHLLWKASGLHDAMCMHMQSRAAQHMCTPT